MHRSGEARGSICTVYCSRYYSGGGRDGVFAQRISLNIALVEGFAQCIAPDIALVEGGRGFPHQSRLLLIRLIKSWL